MRRACQVVLHRLSWMLLGSNLLLCVLGQASFGLLVITGWLLFGLAIAERVLYLQRPGARCWRCGKWLFAVKAEATCNQCGDAGADHATQHRNGDSIRSYP